MSKCAIDGCESGQVDVFSVYCEEHDRETQRSLCEVHGCVKKAVQRTMAGGYRCDRHQVDVTIRDEAFAHMKAWPTGCGVKECDVCASVGRKYDKDKPRYDLIPFKALADVVDVLTYGAKKYAPENWRKVEGWRWRYFGAALRHMVAWFGGERVDPESGHKHLAHAVCCLMFALELDR